MPREIKESSSSDESSDESGKDAGKPSSGDEEEVTVVSRRSSSGSDDDTSSVATSGRRPGTREGTVDSGADSRDTITRERDRRYIEARRRDRDRGRREEVVVSRLPRLMTQSPSTSKSPPSSKERRTQSSSPSQSVERRQPKELVQQTATKRRHESSSSTGEDGEASDEASSDSGDGSPSKKINRVASTVTVIGSKAVPAGSSSSSASSGASASIQDGGRGGDADSHLEVRPEVGDKRDKMAADKDVSASGGAGEGGASRAKRQETTLGTRTGGAYIPPARLRAMQAAITDKSSAEYQRIAWEALKKSINGLVNKVNVGNLKAVVFELFRENVVRGRGLLARTIMQAQMASPTFTHVYAALASVINSKFPQTGELLLRRVIIRFRRSFRFNDKMSCLACVRFIAHLVNQQVAHEVIALELMTLLLDKATNDSVEVCVTFLKECGAKLVDVAPKAVMAVMERLRSILHEAQLDKRIQYMIEVMFAIRKDNFKDFPSVLPDLDLVEEEDQFTHFFSISEVQDTDSQDMLNVFKFDPEFEANEEKYMDICKEILGESDEEGSGSGSESDDESSDGENQDGSAGPQQADAGKVTDDSGVGIKALRRMIFLTIQSSLDFEEAVHKLLKLSIPTEQTAELCHMIVDCCAQQRTYEKFFGLIAQRFCQIKPSEYGPPFAEIFRNSYDTIHRFDTSKLRNVAKLFAHLLFTDAISWGVLEHIHLNEDETTSSSRIFIKILFQELAEYMGLQKLNNRIKDPTLQDYLAGLFPRDMPRNTRFAINFFTSIGLGGITDELREHLKNAPSVPQQSLPPTVEQAAVSSSSSDSSSSSTSSSSSSSSDSDSSSSDVSSSSSDDSSSKRKSKKNKPDKATAAKEARHNYEKTTKLSDKHSFTRRREKERNYSDDESEEEGERASKSTRKGKGNEEKRRRPEEGKSKRRGKEDGGGKGDEGREERHEGKSKRRGKEDCSGKGDEGREERHHRHRERKEDRSGRGEMESERSSRYREGDSRPSRSEKEDKGGSAQVKKRRGESDEEDGEKEGRKSNRKEDSRRGDDEWIDDKKMESTKHKREHDSVERERSGRRDTNGYSNKENRR